MKTTNILIAGVILVALVGAVYFITRSDSDEVRTPQASFSHAHGMALDPQDPTKLYIATHEGLYLLEREQNLYRVGKTKDDLMGFTAHPTMGGAFFSSGHPSLGGNIGFQKTADGGITWEKISNGLGGPVDFHSMTVSRANPEIVFGFFRGLQRSLDGGKNWEMAKGTVMPIALSTHPTRENTVYAATENGVQVSDDRGDSWRSLSPQLEGGAVSVFALGSDASIGLAFSEKFGGLVRSEDGGTMWQKVSENFGGNMIMYLAFSPSSQLVYAITHENAIYKSADSGATWSKVR